MPVRQQHQVQLLQSAFKYLANAKAGTSKGLNKYAEADKQYCFAKRDEAFTCRTVGGFETGRTIIRPWSDLICNGLVNDLIHDATSRKSLDHGLQS